jgi:hypothetical protein
MQSELYYPIDRQSFHLFLPFCVALEMNPSLMIPLQNQGIREQVPQKWGFKLHLLGNIKESLDASPTSSSGPSSQPRPSSFVKDTIPTPEVEQHLLHP